MMQNTIRKSLWSPPRPHTSTIGLSPTNAIAWTGSRPSRRAHLQTSRIVPRLASISDTFSAQNDAATPSGTTAKVSNVNSGPYGLSSWCQLLR